MASKLLFPLALTCAFFLPPRPATAQSASDGPSAAERETARSLMESGDAKLEAGDLQGALEAYESADAIMGVPTTSLAVGRVLARLGQLVSAVDVLARVRRHPVATNEPAAFREARKAAAKLDAELARRIPTVTVEVTGPSDETPVTVAVDGSELTGRPALQPRRVDPGRRVVEVRAPGYRTVRQEVELEEQQHETLTVTLEVDPDAVAAPPSPSPSSETSKLDGDDGLEGGDDLPLTVATWVGFGVGASGLLVGSITGGVVLARTGDLEARCGGTDCPSDERASHESTVTLANVSNASFAIGAVGVAVGTTALILDLTSDEEGADHALQPLVGPGFAGLQGRF